MSEPERLTGLAARIVAVNDLLASMRVPHQFGGAIALAWYRNPRATSDIDLNITVEPTDAAPILGALSVLGVTVTERDREVIKADGQARLDWEGSYLDLFFATLELHQEMAERAREVDFGSARIPILAPEHLVVCKSIFNRSKDWVDIEAMIAWGTEIDADETLRWVAEILGANSVPYERLVHLLWQ